MCKKKFLLVVLLLGALLTFTSCTAVVKGSGNIVSESRQVSNFERIILNGSGEVIVTQGGSETLNIETDDNVMKHLEVEVENGALKLGFKPGVSVFSYTRLVFYVGVDDLNGLTISGSGDIEADSLQTERLEATISGSGDIQITELNADSVVANISGSGEINLFGEITAQDVNISGSGKYLAGEVCSSSVRVGVSGSGDATVCAVDTLDSNISGSGSVNYYGRPSVNSQSSGSGRLNSLGER